MTIRGGRQHKSHVGAVNHKEIGNIVFIASSCNLANSSLAPVILELFGQSVLLSYKYYTRITGT